MGWEWYLCLYVIITVSLLVGGVWIGSSMGVVGLIGLSIIGGTSLWQSMGDILWNISNSFTLTAVPLFVFMGEIILRSGISKRFYDGISHWLRPIPGGLAHSNIVGCAIFAAISGSSTATALTIGTVALPEMRSRGYNDRFIMGSLAAGGCLGILIPPSIVMIIYGSMVQQSIANLFMAGVIPGILITLLFMVYILIRSLINPGLAPKEVLRANRRQMLIGVLNCWPIVALMGFVLGGIYFGIVTPTEAAGIGCSGAIGISLLYRELKWANFKLALTNAVAANCMVMFIIIGAQILTFAVVNANIARELSNFLVESQLTKWQFFVLICVMYAVMGCLIDGISMMLLTLPILYPAIEAMGFDGVWFGVVLVIMIEFGQITPPMGLNLVAIHSISGGRPLSEVAKGALPYIMLLGIIVVLLYLFPEIALWLPETMATK
jgi:C4-dicarboxylate transporter, DctM subunit